MIEHLLGEKTESSLERGAEPAEHDGYADTCSLPPLPGPCTTASIQRWHYHPPSSSCRQFTYGGCQGNQNNFPTVMECEAACAGHEAVETLEVERKDDEKKCLEPPVAGPCRCEVSLLR